MFLELLHKKLPYVVLANFAAALYLIGTICFPVYILFGLLLTIIGFVGAGNQKKISKVVLDA